MAPGWKLRDGDCRRRCSGASRPVRVRGLITANQATAPLALFGLRHVSKSAGTPDNIIAYLRNLPLPVCLHKFGMYDTACDKKVVWIVRAGLTTLPHVHSDEIGTNCRLIAVYRDIVPGQKMLRSFKTSEAFLVACADSCWSDQRCSIRTRHFGFCRKDRGKPLCVKILLIERAKIAMHHTRDFRLVDQLSYFERCVHPCIHHNRSSWFAPVGPIFPQAASRF